MNKQKVLFLISSLQFGGAEKQSVALINQLQSSGLEIYLAYFIAGGQLLEELNVSRLSEGVCLNKKSRFDLRPSVKLYRFIQKIQPDSVVCVNLYPALFAHGIRLFSNKQFRIVQVMHSTLARNAYEEMVIQTIYRFMINRSESIVFVCRTQMDYWVSRYGVNPQLSSFIYNGVDEDSFRSKMTRKEKDVFRMRLDFTCDDVIISTCAALRPEKRHADLLEAFELLVRKNLPVKLLIIGDGPERGTIENKLKELNLEGLVQITGFQKDVRPYLEISDVFCLSSSTETFSIAILEAMSLNKAIVGPKVGGVPEQIIDGENGYTFTVGDVQALSIMLETIVVTKSYHQMGLVSRSRIMGLFRLDLMVKAYYKLLTFH